MKYLNVVRWVDDGIGAACAAEGMVHISRVVHASRGNLARSLRTIDVEENRNEFRYSLVRVRVTFADESMEKHDRRCEGW